MRWMLVLGASMLALGSAAACSSSDTTATTTAKSTCNAVNLQGACLSCVQTKCATEAKGCFGDGWDTGGTVSGAPCSDYYNCAKSNGDCANQTCQSMVTETCERCAEENFGACLSHNCQGECG